MKGEESLWAQSQRACSSVLIGLAREARQDLDRARVPSVKEKTPNYMMGPFFMDKQPVLILRLDMKRKEKSLG